MALAETKPSEGRVLLHLPGAETFSDHLGDFGEIVPRRPPSADKTAMEAYKRATEEWSLRHLLIAWKKAGELSFPIIVRAGRQEEAAAEPDFIVEGADEVLLGIEITQATDPKWQEELTREDRTRGVHETDELDVQLDSDVPTDAVIWRTLLQRVGAALQKKEKKARNGRYRGVGRIELLIYVNLPRTIYLKVTSGLEGGDHVEKMLRFLRRSLSPSQEFEAIHLILDEVVLDAFGPNPRRVNVKADYDVDLYAWSFDQAAKARAGEVAALDLANIAEELESMAKKDRRERDSQMRRLLTHLLKHRYQPQRQTRGWAATIIDARNEIEDVVNQSPSLDPLRLLEVDREKLLAKVYESAVRKAAAETKLPRKAFPPDCPFTLDQILDPEFLPDREPK